MKRFLNTVLAAAIAFTPIVSQAQEYRFRYVTGTTKKVTPPVEEEFGVGNDIQAYFATVVGEEFSRRIPVATKDVVSWKRDEGNLPNGLDVGTESGVIGVVTGTALEAEQTESLWYGFDARGNRIAKARIFFEVVKPEGTMLSASYYAHTNQYFYEVLPSPANIDVSSWEPLGLANVPDGMATRFGALEGSPEEAGTYDVLWQGYDYMNRKVAFLRGTLLVEDGPVIANIPDQFADKTTGQAFNVEPVVKNRLGTITYKLLPVDTRPAGLGFSSSTGKIDRVFDDYDTSASFQIEARDSADGTTGKSNTFKLTTGPAMINMADLRELSGFIDEKKEWKLSAATSANVKLTFAVTAGLLPDGLSLDKDTGVISGTPKKVEIQRDIVITATAQDGTTATAGPFVFRIGAQRLVAETTPLNVRVNTAFTTKPVKIISGIANPMTYTETVSDPAITFDRNSLTFSSTGLANAGRFFQRLAITNAANDNIYTYQTINVYNVPEIAYDNYTVKLKQYISEYPTISASSIAGDPVYTLKQGTLPAGIYLDKNTGRIYGAAVDRATVSDTPYGPFVVSMTDALGVPHDSTSFTIKINDRDNVEWVSTDNSEVQRYVGNGFRVAHVRKTYGAVSYRLEGNVPSTLSVNEYGYIVGTTTDAAGTVYSGLTLHATDSEGYTAPFGPFSLTVVEPKNPPPLWGSYDKSFTWAEDRDFVDFQLPKMANPYGPEKYALAAGAPAMLSIVNGKLEGQMAEPGNYAVAYSITDDLNRTANGTIYLTIQEKIRLQAEPVQTVYRGTNNPFKPTLFNGIGPFTYIRELAFPLPEGMEFDPKTGTIFGKPTTEGDYQARIHITDSIGDNTNTGIFTIRVEKPLPLGLNYPNKNMLVGTFGWLSPVVTSGTDDLVWTHVSGDLPPGVKFISSGSNAGAFYDVPTQIGVWKNIVVDLKDNGTGERLAKPYTFDMTVEPQGELTFAPGTIRMRASAISTPTMLQTGNNLGKVEYEFHADSQTYPGQLTLNSDGTLTSSFSETGIYDGILITAKDNGIPGRSKTSPVSIEVVDVPKVSIAASNSMKEFQSGDIPFTLENIIGTPTVTITGANAPEWLGVGDLKLTGTPDNMGSISGLGLNVVDGHDNAANNSDPFEIVVGQRDALGAADNADFIGKQYQTATLDIPFQNAIGNVTLTTSPALPSEITSTVTDGNLHLEGTFDATYNGTYTLTLKDEKGGARGTKTVNLTVNIAPRDALSAADTADFIGKQYQTAMLDIPFEHAIGAVTVTSNPTLPSELTSSVVGNNLHLEGKFDAIFNGTYTLTLKDEKGGSRGTQTITVNVNIAPRDALTATATTTFSAQQFETKSIDIPFEHPIGAVEVTSVPALPDELVPTIVGNNLHLEGRFDTLNNSTYTLTLKDEKGGARGTHAIALTVDIVPREQLTMTMTEEPVLGQQLASLSVKVADVQNNLAPVSLTTVPDLPEGLVLGADGILSGIPETLLEETVFTVHATDGLGGNLGKAQGTFTLTIAPRTQLTMEMVQEPVVGKQFNDMAPLQVATVFDALGPVTITTNPPLPEGLVLANNGMLSGKSTSALSETTFTVHATDGLGGNLGKASGTFTLTVGPRDQLALQMPETPVVGKQYAKTGLTVFTPVNDAAPLTLTVTPELPDELTLGSDGILRGKPTQSMEETTYTVNATDGLGGNLGKANGTFKLTINVRDPLKLIGPATFSFNQYFPGSFTLTQENAIDGHTFSAVSDLPASLTLIPTTGVVEGKPTEKFDDTFVFRVTDGVGGSANHSVHIKVEDRLAPVISANVEQPALLGYDFGKTLETENILGTVAWTHVSGTLPDGVLFDDVNGRFHGKPTAYGTFDNIIIGMTDTYEGVTTPATNKTFKIIVQQDGSPITLTGTANTATRVSNPLTLDGPMAANTVGDTSISVTGLTGTGLSYNAKTGKITGTPTTVGSISAIFTASDVTGRSATLTMTIDVKAKLTVSMTPEQDALFNYSLADAGFQQPQAGNVHGTAVWSIVDASKLPQGVTFDPATASFIGTPLEIGAFGPIQLTVSDDLPGSTTSSPMWITVLMNEDPISLTVTNVMSKVGYPFTTELPISANTLGGVRFYSLDLAGTNLKVDPVTGIMTGSFSSPQDRNINLSITDETLRVTSKPIRLQILPKMVLFAAATTRVAAQEPMTPIKVTRQNVVGTAVWHDIDPTTLPEGISFNTSNGQFEGFPNDIGTFGPFYVESTDSLGDKGRSNPITIISQPGSLFVNLLTSPLANAVKRFDYSFDFRTLIDPRSVGVDVSELAWSLTGATPPGLTIDPATGILSGKPSLSGQYDFRVNVSFGSKTWGRNYTLNVVLPDAGLTLVSDVDGLTPQATRFVTGEDHTFTMDYSQFLTLKNVPKEDVRWALEPFAQGENLPQDLFLDPATGIISGTARSTEGTYNFRLTARWTHGTDENYHQTVAYSIRVNDTLKFTLAAAGQPIEALKRASMAHDFGQYVSALPATHKSRLVFSMTAKQVDQDGVSIDPPTATLSGIGFVGTELRGIPVVSGSYDLTITASIDSRIATMTHHIDVGLQNIDLTLNTTALANAKTKEAYSFDFKTKATATNIPINQVRWTTTTNVALQNGEMAGLPPGLALNEATGILSGTPTGAGYYRFEVKANWADNNPTAETRNASAIYAFEVEASYKFAKIAAGAVSTCGVTTTGGVKCWGNPIGGSTGMNIILTPTDVPTLTSGVKDISGRGWHMCALKTNGDLFCWGDNSSKQLNRNTGAAYTTPSLSATGVASVSTGSKHTCIVTNAGEAKCWGENENGQLGNNSTSDSIMVQVQGLTSGVKSIHAGTNYTCAVLNDTTAKCWGDNEQRKLGGRINGNSDFAQSNVPINVLMQLAGQVPESSISYMNTGDRYTCSISLSGNLRCFGWLSFGQLIDYEVNGQVSVMSTGANHSCFITPANEVKCFGAGNNGMLGDGSSSNSRYVVTVKGLGDGAKAVAISAGLYHSCAVLENGAAKCWGRGGFGVLGNGDLNNSSIAVDVLRE